MSEMNKSLSPSGAFNHIFLGNETSMEDIEDLDNITLNVKKYILVNLFICLMKENDVEEDEEKLEMSDIRRSSLSQLTREGDLDRVRRFLDFTGDQSLKRINKLDESKVAFILNSFDEMKR